MRPLKPGQCLLLTDASAMYVRNGNFWLNNVYIRLRTTDRTRSAEFHPALVSVTDAPIGRLYMTNVTLQGSSIQASTGLYIASGAYIAGAHLTSPSVSTLSVWCRSHMMLYLPLRPPMSVRTVRTIPQLRITLVAPAICHVHASSRSPFLWHTLPVLMALMAPHLPMCLRPQVSAARLRPQSRSLG